MPVCILQVLKLVGMTHLDYLTLEDQASLCLVEKFVKFKQGDMWRKMKEEFLAEVSYIDVITRSLTLRFRSVINGRLKFF